MSSSKTESFQIAYVFSEKSSLCFDTLPSNVKRSSLVHSLIRALDLFQYMKILPPYICSKKFLEQFHTSDYLDIVLNETPDTKMDSFCLEYHGLIDDCSMFPELKEYSLFLGGSVQTILNALDCGFRYVINWDGGRHHALSSQASGYCFINDVVLLILGLMPDYYKILYIDLDLHHGDGVEKAFYFSDRVFTLSFHKHLPGFFPGTGSLQDRGKSSGLGFCLNVPISHKISGKYFFQLFQEVFTSVYSSFDPDIIVCVCGADILSTDPNLAFNVGSKYYSECISSIVQTKIPTIFLGGGGYNHSDSAKCWSILTHSILSSCSDIPDLPANIPDFDRWPDFAFDDRMEVCENISLIENESSIVSEILFSVHEILNDR